jgi:hypothetical protein
MNRNEFFKHICDNISALTKIYAIILQELTGIKSKAIGAKDVSYSFVLRKLKRAIDAFKQEMAACLTDYYMLKDNNLELPYALTHIQEKLKDLKEVHKNASKQIPMEILRKELDYNYYFHQNIRKLNASKIMQYFETNYMLRIKKGKK